ncbi:MAG: glycosyltransferase family 1 protein, partial [Verrucomicrobiota bacterium]|nr:glycosyltransferase family 1 protein [Verrucomicrobiota bacterium]
MRVALLCLGSEGDVRIFVTLGVALKADGHEVVIFSNTATEKLCIENKLDFLPLAGDLLPILNIDKKSVGYGNFQILKLLIRVLNEAIGEQFSFLENELKKFDAVLYHPVVFTAPHLIEGLGIPAMSVLFLPEVPSRYYASSCIFPNRKPSKKWSNLLSHYILAQVFWTPMRKTFNFFRNKMGLKKLGHLAPLSHAPFCQIPKLLAFSEALVPPAPDWPSNAYITGYLHSPPTDFMPPKELEQFLSDGPAPVFIGFGSLAKRGDEKMLFAILKTLCALKIRAILGGPFTGLKKEELPDHILWIERAPYDWLFPKVCAVVHHGGAGTTHCSLKAGKPTLIVPFLLDQFYWGNMIWRFGAGPKPLPANQFTAKTFTASLQQLIHN